jgi:hypothetical protein
MYGSIVRGEAAGREAFEEVIRNSKNMISRWRQAAQTSAKAMKLYLTPAPLAVETVFTLD